MNEKQVSELLAVMTDIRALLQLGLHDRLAELRLEHFDDDDKAEAFRLFHQGGSFREIGRQIGVRHSTVSRWVDSWRSAGLAHPTEQRCLVTPQALGIG